MKHIKNEQDKRLLRKIREGLKQEGPFACKEISSVIETVSGVNITQPVAELRPLLTVKG